MMQRIREMISNQLNLPLEKVLPESKIVQELGADSLDVVEMLMELENEFGIIVSDEQAQELVDLRDIEKLIKQNK